MSFPYSNKYQDINTFLPAYNLFKSQKPPSSTPKKSDILPFQFKNNKTPHRYYLLNQISQDNASHHEPNKNINEKKQNTKHKQLHRYFTSSAEMETSLANKDNRDDSPIHRQGRIEEQYSSIGNGRKRNLGEWQNVVVKSSRRYFDSCREQAVEYLENIENILFKSQKNMQKNSIDIRSWIKGFHQSEGEKLKQSLYKLVDETVEIWKLSKIYDSQSRQIQYLSEVFQLNTQLERRLSELTQIQKQLQEGVNWKTLAGDLLINNHQVSVLQLSKQCQKAIGQSKQLMKNHITLQQKYNSEEWQNNKLKIKQQFIQILQCNPNFMNPNPTIVKIDERKRKSKVYQF